MADTGTLTVTPATRTATPTPKHAENYAGTSPITRASGTKKIALGDLAGVESGLNMVSVVVDAGAILLVPCDQPWEAVTRVGFADWNDCPNPAEHAAYLRYFFDALGATPTAVGADTVRLDVKRAVDGVAQLAELARVFVNYCSELEEAGAAAVAQTLSLGPGPWAIWWD